MAKKSDGLVADRPVLSLRPQADLKRRLEEAAAASGRSMAREAEVRLEASFESASASKLERFIKNRPGLSYMVGTPAPVELTNQLGDVLSSVVRHADDQSWSEFQTREALAAAMGVVTYYYFWRPSYAPPVPDVSPIPPADTKVRDLPPALAGYSIAEGQMLFSASLQDHSIYQATVDQKIMNVWSGDGKKEVEWGLTPLIPPSKKRRSKEPTGSFVEPEELDKFKPALPTWFQVLSARETEREKDRASK